MAYDRRRFRRDIRQLAKPLKQAVVGFGRTIPTLNLDQQIRTCFRMTIRLFQFLIVSVFFLVRLAVNR